MDDLLDLDWKQPIGSSSQSTTTTSTLKNNNNNNNNNTNSSTMSRPNYYYSSSSVAPVPNTSNKQSPNPSSNAATTSFSADAFASLFAPSNSKQEANLSLAERQKKAQIEAARKAQAHTFKSNDDAIWAGIESEQWIPSTSSTPLAPSSRTQSPAKPHTSSTRSRPNNKALDPWDFDTLSSDLPATSGNKFHSTADPTSRTAVKSNADPFDFDAFDSSAAPTSLINHDSAQTSNDADDDADDILGALAKPIGSISTNTHRLEPQDALHSRSTTTSSAESSRVPSPATASHHRHRPSTTSRSTSPPPHIIGQLVEMGFSPQQARKALAQTKTGTDVQAALESLVGSDPSQPAQYHHGDEHLARQIQQQERAHSEQGGFRDSDDAPPSLPGRRTRQANPHGQSQDPRQASTNNNPEGRSPAPGNPNADWQQQADQIYAQASEIGASVLNKATAFWSSAKAQAQKALEERNKSAAERSTTPSDTESERRRNRRWGTSAATRKQDWEGKPRWMLEAEAEAAREDEQQASGSSAALPPGGGGFKDSDDESQEMPPNPTRTPRPASHAARTEGQPVQPDSNLWDDPDPTKLAHSSRSKPPSSHNRSETVADRLKTSEGATKKAYVSRNRHAPSRSAAPSSHPATTATTNLRSTTRKRRSVGSVSSAVISSAKQHKDQGNEHFRKGAYGEAEACYTRGISAFDSSDTVQIVPLLSNRANVRLKNGDASGTIQDCDQLLQIVLSLFGGAQRDGKGQIAIYRASEEEHLPPDLGDINLRETFGKALLRRAQALEASEKWKLAKADWEVLLEYEKVEGSGYKTGASNMKFAREGLLRCGKMLGDKTNVPTGSANRSAAGSNRRGPAAVTASSTGSRATPTTANSENYRKMQSQQAAEEAEKFELMESVDAKIDGWKKGKESNLRALLSSLDMILWPELNWKPVGLQQLLDQNGLKKNYTKAIAKLHPDKISKSATTEQKMIASSAFHALNEAWNSQQSV